MGNDSREHSLAYRKSEEPLTPLSHVASSGSSFLFVAAFACALAGCDVLSGGDPVVAPPVEVPFQRLDGFFTGYAHLSGENRESALVARSETAWEDLVQAGPGRAAPNFAGSLVLVVLYGEVPADQTGGENAEVVRFGERVAVRVSPRMQPVPRATADVFKESYVQVARADAGEEARFEFVVPAEVDTVRYEL